MYGPYLSPIGGGQALTSPKRHSLGKPLPYQLADTTQAVPKAINLCSEESIKYYPIFRLVIPDFWGRYLFYTMSSAGALASPLTCMPYPRRQRSS